jgi:hypothetical protein
MEYRATFRSMAGLTVIFVPIAGLSIAAGIKANAPGLIAIGLLLIALLLAIRLRFKVVVNEDEIIATGFFRTRRVRLAELTGAKWMVDYGYPRDRFYGPFTYELQTPKETLRINFKLFPLACMSEVLERTKALAADAALAKDER